MRNGERSSSVIDWGSLFLLVQKNYDMEEVLDSTVISARQDCE